MYSGTHGVVHALIGCAMLHTFSVRLALHTGACAVQLPIGCEMNDRLIALGDNGRGFLAMDNESVERSMIIARLSCPLHWALDLSHLQSLDLSHQWI